MIRYFLSIIFYTCFYARLIYHIYKYQAGKIIMKTESFLKVGEQPITFTKAMSYLQTSGQLSSVVSEIIRQYILEQELEKTVVSSNIIEETVNNFRRENQLKEQKEFERWLAQQEVNQEEFTRQVTKSIKLEKLISEITEPRLQEYFINKKLFLDQVVLSRLVVKESELAEEIKSQVDEEEARFEELVQEYSIAEDSIFNGMMGTVSRGKLPDQIRSNIDSAKVGELIGPLQLADNWYLFRLEKKLPASLASEQLQQTLRDEIFEDWLNIKMQKLEIEMNLIN